MHRCMMKDVSHHIWSVMGQRDINAIGPSHVLKLLHIVVD